MNWDCHPSPLHGVTFPHASVDKGEWSQSRPTNTSITKCSFSWLNVSSAAATAAAKSLQSCPTLRPHRHQPSRLHHPWDSPGKNTGVGYHFLLQGMKVKVKSLSHVRLLATPWTAAYQAPPSTGFSRQEYWSGLPYEHTKQMQTTLIVS